MEILEMVDTMKQRLERIEEDVEKFERGGNMSAGTRIRKVMQEIKKDAQEVRIRISEIKNN